MTRWLEPLPEPVAPDLLAAVGGNPLVARLLARRGLTDPDAALAFLDPALYKPSSPFELPGMATLADALREAIDQGKRIRIWGDLDADGQTATAVLFEMLSACGARVDYRLPRHNQGHGLPLSAVEQAHDDGIDVLLTCDTGITDVEPVRWATEHGLQVLITDHHDMPEELPPAAAVVDSKALPAEHPMATLAGVGVAYQVARALLDDGERVDELDAMLDLVALGLVVDMVAQRGEVRYLVQRGLDQMRRQPRAGIAALAELARVDLTHLSERHLQFQIGPRVNAAGRLGDAEEYLELLLTDDRERAVELAGRLESLNRDRRARTEALREQLQDALARDADALRQPAIVLQGEGWPEGVLGAAAGDLAREYGRPAILIAHHEGGLSTASARSVEGVDIRLAIASQADKLARHGGHPMAAGFAAQRTSIDLIVRGILASLGEAVPIEGEETLSLDAELSWANVSMGMAEQLARLRPFGSGNEQPVFMLRRARLERAEPLGNLGASSPHRRLHLSDGADMRLPIVWFRAGDLPLPGEWIDIAFQMDLGHWRGVSRLDVQLVDWRPTSHNVHETAAMTDAFEVIDWRDRPDLGEAISELEQRFGEELWIWAEGQNRPQQALTRGEWGSERCVALALAGRPASPEILADVIATASPQYVALLPCDGSPDADTTAALRLAAGLGRAAVSKHGGLLNFARAEQAVGLPEQALRLAIEILVLRGVLMMVGDRLAAAPQTTGAQCGVDDERLLASLTRILREVAAYRRAYASLPADVLLAEDA